ncbi:hypothetical protein ACWDWS_20525 [Streptomyces sp. NPDC003328]|uniref:hypothetical protein n=1 Tax=unclassified Streptomyces TaxID=2593676 RepID=UPI00362D0315
MLRSQGLLDAVSYKETEAFETGSLMLRHEGILIFERQTGLARGAVGFQRATNRGCRLT